MIAKCEKCGKPVSSTTPGVVKAEEVKEYGGYMSRRELAGRKVLFHAKCWSPANRQFRKAAF